MGALPKRRLSTGRQGRREMSKKLTASGRGARVTSRDRRAKKQGKTETTA